MQLHMDIDSISAWKKYRKLSIPYNLGNYQTSE